MITANEFLAPARERGFDFYTGVPCSFLTPLINAVIGSRELTYVGAASEGEAVAIASGAWLAGRKTVVMCQNSGLGNTVNPLTSLNHPFHIPTMMVVTWRGQPGLKDEPQHVLMGQITDKLLETMRIPYAGFPTEAGAINPALDSADAVMAKSDLPFAFIMAHGTVRDDGLQTNPVRPRKRGVYSDMTNGAAPPARAAVLERLLSVAPEQAAIIATTGKTGRELFTLADRPQHLYQVGAMGAASGMALGVALNAKRKVIVLDGDGAALMKLGTFATIGAYAPKNLIHIVLDNGVHDFDRRAADRLAACRFRRGGDGVQLCGGFCVRRSRRIRERVQTRGRARRADFDSGENRAGINGQARPADGRPARGGAAVQGVSRQQGRGSGQGDGGAGVAQYARVEVEAHQVLADQQRAGIVLADFGDQCFAVELGRHEVVEDQAADAGLARHLADFSR